MIDGLICAFDIGPEGKAVALDDPSTEVQADHWRWLHFDRESTGTADWLHAAPFTDPRVAEVLLSGETRPDFLRDSDDPRGGSTLILRGVNLNEGAEPHEMISLRMFVDVGLVITVRRDRIFAINDLKQRYESGHGPQSPAHFMEALVEGITSRITQTVRDLEYELDLLEERITRETTDERLREDLLGLRREIIPIRRYVLPQRDALEELAREDNAWTTPDENDDMQRAAEETIRLVEALDALRERAGLLQEQISSELADRMNRNTYALSIVAAIFLPLGFLTGLLGINVGGMPGTESPYAFWVVVALCIGSAALALYLMRRARLL